MLLQQNRISQSKPRVGRTFSPLQKPMTAPVSLIQSFAPLTAALAMPVFLLLWPFLNPTPSRSPVAYSDPMLGSTFSPALRLTNNANGTSQTHRPKYDAISVNVG